MDSGDHVTLWSRDNWGSSEVAQLRAGTSERIWTPRSDEQSSFLSISLPFQDRQDKAILCYPRARSNLTHPSLFTKMGHRDVSRRQHSPSPCGESETNAPLAGPVRNNESDEMKKYLVFCWNKLGFVFSFFHQLKQPQDSFLSTNMCPFLYKHYLISFSQGPHISNYNPTVCLKTLRLRKVKHLAWQKSWSVYHTQVLIIRPELASCQSPLVYVAVQWNWDLGAGVGSGQSEDPCGSISPRNPRVAQLCQTTLVFPQPPSDPCFFSQCSQQNRAKSCLLLEESSGKRQKALILIWCGHHLALNKLVALSGPHWPHFKSKVGKRYFQDPLQVPTSSKWAYQLHIECRSLNVFLLIFWNLPHHVETSCF